MGFFRFDKTEGIVVIGATNFPEILDKYVTQGFLLLIFFTTIRKDTVFRSTNVTVISRALVRPGRFDSRVNVPMPDVRARKSILELHLGKVKLADGKNIIPISIVKRPYGLEIH